MLALTTAKLAAVVGLGMFTIPLFGALGLGLNFD